MSGTEKISVTLFMAAIQQVITRTAIKNIRTFTSIKAVITFVAIKHIVAIATTEGVVTGAAVEDVVPTVTVQGIVTVFAGKIVGTLIAAQAVVAVAANAVSQGFQVLFAEDVSVLGESAVLSRFSGKLHELLGQWCHCSVFAVGVAFSEQFAEIGEGFAGVFRVNFVEEGGNAAVVQLQLAVLAHAEADGVEIGFEAGLEEQAVVEVIGKIGVGFFDGVDDMLRL